MGKRSLQKWFLRVRKDAPQLPPSAPSDCVTSISNSEPTNLDAVLATPAINQHEQHSSSPTNPQKPTSTSSKPAQETIKSQRKAAGEEETKRQSTHGLLLLNPSPPKPSDPKYPIDIIAVHGITGDAYTTFQHKSGFFWLRDALPKEFPGARIYSYGYEADVFWSRGTGGFDEFARTLLEDLKRVRKSVEDQRRPIVFICHSMGGIVVKEALNITHVDTPRFDNIRDSIFAILFLAVPHRGSDAAPLLSILTSIADLGLKGTGISRVSGGVRSDLVKSLSKGSPRVLKILKDFRKFTSRVKIYSFYEQNIIRGMNHKIVDDCSATMGHDGEVPIEMPGCDHQTICRFENEDSMPYQRILGILQEVAFEITSKLTAELQAEDLPCLASLTFPSISNRLSTLSSALPETCTWIRTHPSFLAWTSSSTANNVLYIKGHPGTGKSTLLSFLYGYFLQQPIQYGRILLSFFFHGNGDVLQKSRVGMFRSLLVQLYKQSFSARRMILTAFNEKKLGTEERKDLVWTLDELQSLFSEILLSEQTREKEVVIFIDALDEVADEVGSRSAPSLLTFFHHLNGAVVWKGAKTKICISCRQYPVVAVNAGGLQISIQEENRKDIERYVSSQLSLLVQDWSVQPSGLRNELEKAMVDKADGVFLWVVKRLARIVDDLNDGAVSLSDIKKLVESESNELFVLYEDILRRDVKKGVWEKALLLMQWICLSERPLTLVEIRMAIACDDNSIKEGQGKIEDSCGYVESDERMEKLIRSLLGGLAEVRCGVVQLFHQSVTDFLRERGIRTLFAATIDASITDWTDERILGISQDRLSKSCFRYLGLGEVAKIPVWASGLLVQKFPEVEGHFPFIRYATAYSFVHAERAEASGIPQEYLVELLEPEPGAHEEIRYDPEEMIGRSPTVFETWKIVFKEIDGFQWRYPDVGSSLIHVAASFNLQSVIRHLVGSGCSVDQGDYDQRTALHFAARLGYESTTSMLLDFGADIEAKTISGRSPLGFAVTHGQDTVARLLIRRGAKVNIGDGQFANMLEAACNVKGSIGLVADLVGYGASINGHVEATSTALQEAAYLGNEEVVRYLISKGADVNAKGKKYGSTLHAAVQGPDSQLGRITRLLLDKKANVNSQGGEFGNPLQAAAQRPGRDNTHIMMMLLNEGADINAQGGMFCTALQAACTTSKVDSVKLLLAMGADVHIQGGKFGTALQAASRHNTDVVPLLLSHGADVNVEGGYYGSALQCAAASHDVDIVKMLLEHGARVDIRGGFHGSALQAAAWGGDKEIVTIFLDLGADINESGGDAGSALQAAIPMCTERFIRFLLDKGADVNLQGGGEGNALRATLVWPREAIIKLLLERGADIHACIPGKYDSAFQLALAKEDPKLITLLLDHGKNNNPKDEWYKQAVERAKRPGKERIAELLLRWKVQAELGN